MTERGSALLHSTSSGHTDSIGKAKRAEAASERGVVAIARIGEHGALWHAVGHRLFELIEHDLRFGLKDDLVGDTRLLTALLVVGPDLWEIETQRAAWGSICAMNARWRWDALTCYADDGRLEISNNAAENAIWPLKLGRKNWLFLGSDAGGERAAIFYTLLRTAKLNRVQPEAYLRQVLTRSARIPSTGSTSGHHGPSANRRR